MYSLERGLPRKDEQNNKILKNSTGDLYISKQDDFATIVLRKK